MKRRLWLWFAAGFLAMFVLLAWTLSTYAMLPAGRGVISVKLWQFYANEWPKAFGPQIAGPASSNQDNLIRTTLQHLGLSALGAAGLTAIAWTVQRRKRGPE